LQASVKSSVSRPHNPAGDNGWLQKNAPAVPRRRYADSATESALLRHTDALRNVCLLGKIGSDRPRVRTTRLTHNGLSKWRRYERQLKPVVHRASRSYRSAANMRHSPGIPLRDWVPRSLKCNPEPATRSFTVLDTKTSLALASAATRAPM
jgi:hypothetical protein